MYRFFTIVRRDIENLAANPILLVYNTVFPFLMVLILGYLGNGGYGSSGMNAYDFYGVTMLLFIVLNVSVTASNTFMERAIRTSNLRVIHSPIRTSWVYLTKIVSTFLFTFPCFLVMMALSHFALGVDYGGANTAFIVALVLLFDLMSASLGVLFCCVFKSEELANKILSLLNNVLAVLGGLFFQLDGLGKVAAAVSAVSPVKWVLRSMMGIIYDGSLSSFLPAALSLAALTALCILGCKFFFRTEDYV